MPGAEGVDGVGDLDRAEDMAGVHGEDGVRNLNETGDIYVAGTKDIDGVGDLDGAEDMPGVHGVGGAEGVGRIGDVDVAGNVKGTEDNDNEQDLDGVTVSLADIAPTDVAVDSGGFIFVTVHCEAPPFSDRSGKATSGVSKDRVLSDCSTMSDVVNCEGLSLVS